jgi:hypothetical protein
VTEDRSHATRGPEAGTVGELPAKHGRHRAFGDIDRDDDRRRARARDAVGVGGPRVSRPLAVDVAPEGPRDQLGGREGPGEVGRQQ